MATNKPYGDNHRIGAVKDRSQTYNPVTNQWVERDTHIVFLYFFYKVLNIIIFPHNYFTLSLGSENIAINVWLILFHLKK